MRLDREEELRARERRRSGLRRPAARALRRAPRRAAREIAPRLLERAHGEDEPARGVEQVHVAARAHELEQQLGARVRRIEDEREDAVAVAEPRGGEARAREVRAEVLREGRRGGRRRLRRRAERDPRRPRAAGKEEGAARAAPEAELELERLALDDALEPRPGQVLFHRRGGPLQLSEAQHGRQVSSASPRGGAVFRQLGGSFGVALLTTVLDRRAEVHRFALSEHAGRLDPIAAQQLSQATAGLMGRGLDAHGVERAAAAMIEGGSSCSGFHSSSSSPTGSHAVGAHA